MQTIRDEFSALPENNNNSHTYAFSGALEQNGLGLQHGTNGSLNLFSPKVMSGNLANRLATTPMVGA